MRPQATGYRLQVKLQATRFRPRGPSCSLERATCSLVCVLLLVLTGCVHQQLTIRSEPPGAELLLNDQHLGTTPCAHDFLWYGWYRITLTKPGYERLDERVLINTPWYLWMPLDLVMELVPFDVRDTRMFSFQLRPQTPLSEPTPPVTSVPASHGKTTQVNGGT